MNFLRSLPEGQLFLKDSLVAESTNASVRLGVEKDSVAGSDSLKKVILSFPALIKSPPEGNITKPGYQGSWISILHSVACRTLLIQFLRLILKILCGHFPGYLASQTIAILFPVFRQVSSSDAHFC